MTAPRNEVLSVLEAQELAAYLNLHPNSPMKRLVERLMARIESDAARSAALRRVAEAAHFLAQCFHDRREQVGWKELNAALADLDRLTKAAT